MSAKRGRKTAASEPNMTSPAASGALIAEAPRAASGRPRHSARRPTEEQRESERSLGESADRLRALATTLGHLYWSAAADGQMDDCSLWCAFTGQSAEQVIGWGWLDAMPAEDRARVAQVTRAAVASQTPYEYECRIRRHDGTLRTVLVRVAPVFNADASLRDWASVGTDLTEHSQADKERDQALARERMAHVGAELARAEAQVAHAKEEVARAEAEAASARFQAPLDVLPVGVVLAERASQLEAIFEAMTEGVTIYDAHGRIVKANRAFYGMMGLEADPDYLSRPYRRRVAPLKARDQHDRPIPFERMLLTRVLKGEVVPTAEAEDTIITTRDGRNVTLSRSAAPIRDAQGRIVGALIVHRDVTVRRQLERVVAEQASELGAIFEAKADGILVYDAQGHLRRMNSTAQQLLGFDADPAFALLPPIERAKQLRLYDERGMPVPEEQRPHRRVLRGEHLTGANAMDMLAHTVDGRTVQLSVVGAPISTHDGKIVGGVLICRDVTARRQLDRQVAEQASQLEAIFEAISDGIVVFDRDKRVTRTNQKWQNLMRLYADIAGLSANPQFAATPLAEMPQHLTIWDEQGQVIPPEKLPTAQALRGETVTGASAVEEWVHSPDGRELQVSVTAAPVRDSEGQITGSVSVVRDVTARRQIERAVAEQAGQLEAIFEAQADGVAVFDAYGRFVRANTALRQLFGFDADPEYTALPLSERAQRLRLFDEQGQLIPEDQWPHWRVLRGEILAGASAMGALVRTLDGREMWVSTSGAPVHAPDGQITGVVLITRDITARWQLERQVVEQASQLEAIFEAISDGVLVHDAQGRVLRMNTAYRDLLRLEAAPDYAALPLRERVQRLVVKDDQGQLIPEAQWVSHRLLRGEALGGENAQDAVVRALDGRIVELNTTGAAIRDSDNQIVGAVLVLRDVTARRRLERRTQQALRALVAMAETLVEGAKDTPDEAGSGAGASETARHLAELTRSVLDCQSIAVVTVDPETGALSPAAVVADSPERERRWRESLQQIHLDDRLAAQDVARLRAGEVLVRDLRPSQFRAPPYRSAPQVLIAPLRVGERLIGALGVGYGGETHTYSSDEIELAGAVAKLAALAIERERLLCEREEARAQELALREANQRMDDFLAVASHDLRSPLTTSSVSVQHAARSFKRLTADAGAEGSHLASQLVAIQRTLEMADQNLRRLNQLVARLFDVTRARAGALELLRKPCDLVAIVRDAVEEQRGAAPNRIIQAAIPAAQTVPVFADAERMGQVVTNYLTNALRYSSQDRPIEVTLSVEGVQARLSVRDEGSGIPAAQQDAVWARFGRAQGVATQSGTETGLGLGLYISRTIVESHEGQVGLHSVVGEGSTFWFTLPVAVAPTGEREDQPPL
jgi:PAS domain S-box-containing protein